MLRRRASWRGVAHAAHDAHAAPPAAMSAAFDRARLELGAVRALD